MKKFNKKSFYWDLIELNINKEMAVFINDMCKKYNYDYNNILKYLSKSGLDQNLVHDIANKLKEFNSDDEPDKNVQMTFDDWVKYINNKINKIEIAVNTLEDESKVKKCKKHKTYTKTSPYWKIMSRVGRDTANDISNLYSWICDIKNCINDNYDIDNMILSKTIEAFDKVYNDLCK